MTRFARFSMRCFGSQPNDWALSVMRRNQNCVRCKTTNVLEGGKAATNINKQGSRPHVNSVIAALPDQQV